MPQELDCRLWHRETLYSHRPFKLVTCDPSWIVEDAEFNTTEVLYDIFCSYCTCMFYKLEAITASVQRIPALECF